MSEIAKIKVGNVSLFIWFNKIFCLELFHLLSSLLLPFFLHICLICKYSENKKKSNWPNNEEELYSFGAENFYVSLYFIDRRQIKFPQCCYWWNSKLIINNSFFLWNIGHLWGVNGTLGCHLRDLQLIKRHFFWT